MKPMYFLVAMTFVLILGSGTVAWSSATSRILVSIPDIDDEGKATDYEIWIVDDSGANPQKLTNNSASPPIHDREPRFCGGDKIVFSREEAGDTNIWIMNTDGTSPVNLTPGTSGSQETKPDCGLLAVNGATVVFRSNMDHDRGEIYTLRTDLPFQVPTRLTYNDFVDVDPAWCGTRIVFSRDLQVNPPSPGVIPNREIYLMDSNGANAWKVTEDGHGDTEPACSADSTQIAFRRWIGYAEADAGEIFRLEICPEPGPCCSSDPGSCPGLRRLTTQFNCEDGSPTWSPGSRPSEGSWGNIAFVSTRTSPEGPCATPPAGIAAGLRDTWKFGAQFGETQGAYPTKVTCNPSANSLGCGVSDDSPDWGETK